MASDLRRADPLLQRMKVNEEYELVSAKAEDSTLEIAKEPPRISPPKPTVAVKVPLFLSLL